MNKIIRGIFIIGFAAAILISGYYALQIQNVYKEENIVHLEEMKYAPEITDPAGIQIQRPETYVNQNIIHLQTLNKDVVGWIKIPYTKIDYPFVQAADNEAYLHKDLQKLYSAAGTVFMECQNKKDFSDFNTILYGHHMKNGSMFASLNKFGDKDFFDMNKTGTVYLADQTYEIEFFAYAVIRPDDNVFYNIPSDSNSAQTYLNNVKTNAKYYRGVDISPSDRIITLSTCGYEFQDAREVLLGKLNAAVNTISLNGGA